MNDVQPPHDYEDLQGYLNGLEAALLAATAITCHHCRATGKPLAKTGNGWGVEVFHEPDCPDHDYNLPTPERPA